MNVTPQELFLIIGEMKVECELLKREVLALRQRIADLEEEAKELESGGS